MCPIKSVSDLQRVFKEELEEDQELYDQIKIIQKDSEKQRK